MLFSTKTICLAVVVWLFACTPMVHAKTITVMKDGSGGFEQIQPALDAAASGDTLLIGPGEYVDFTTMYFPGYPEDPEIYAFIPVEDLTIIGAGRTETIIGPLTHQGSWYTYSPICFRWQGGGSLRISGLTMRNCFEGVHSGPGLVYIDDCNLFDNNDGIFWETQGSGGRISNCHIESNILGGPDGVIFYGSGSDIVVEDCLFDGVKVSIKNLESISIHRCEIRNSIVGLQVAGGAYCYIEDSMVYNCANVGISLAPTGAVCEIVDCEISGDGVAIAANIYGQLLATNTIFNGGYWGVIDFSNASDSVVTNCDLRQGTGPQIRSYRHPSYGPVTHDLRNNYWGMTNPDEIRALILDGTNDPDNASIVLFEPFVGDLSPADTPSPVVGLSVHPNPFNPLTTVSFSINYPQNVELCIFDMTGKRIAVLADREFQTGAHSLDWRGRDLQGRAVASGTYLVRMITDEGATSEKMVLVR